MAADPGPAGARIRQLTALALAPGAAVAVAVFADGGYSTGSRIAFSVAALGAGALVLAGGGDRPTGAGPVVAVLAGLAILGALSALWTVGLVDRALVWALVTAGYAAVAASACVVARRDDGMIVLVAIVAVLAVAAGGVGLAATAFREPPYAELLNGGWRPGGPFQYPPALALLEVSALPALLVAASRGSGAIARPAALGLAVAGGVLALSASRVGLAMAITVAGVAVVAHHHTTGRSRGVVAGAVGLCLVSGLVLGLGLDREGDLMVRVALLVATPLAAAAMWPALRRRLERPLPARPGRGPSAVAVAGVLVLAVGAGSVAFGWAAGQEGGFLHGRGTTWAAAADTFADHPVIGAGADAYLTASVSHQGGQSVRFAHSLPLELASELGILGVLAAAGLYGLSARMLWRARRTAAGWLLGPTVAGFLVAGLIDWPWHLAGSGAVWALALGGLAPARLGHLDKGYGGPSRNY